jgi:alpha-L-fucosidase 2
MKSDQSSGPLGSAVGENPNPFYRLDNTLSPGVPLGVAPAPLTLNKTWLYDLATEPGKTYTLIEN